MRIWLIRHGLSTGNEEKIMQGLHDYPLAHEGRTQARIVGRHLAAREARPNVIYASPLTRTRETAELIVGRLAQPTPPIEYHEALREIDVGRLSGLTLKEIRRRYPDFFRVNPHGWLNFQPWGGQDADVYFHALYRWMDELTRDWDFNGRRSVAFIVHGITIRALYSYLFNERESRQMHLRLGNCVTLELHFEGKGTGLKRKLVSMLPVEEMNPEGLP